MTSGSFALRNVICDYYLEPVNEFSAQKYGRPYLRPGEVPPPLTVMRFFGIAPDGSKCCAHIHGFLPYVIFRAKSRLNDGLRAHFTSIIGEVVAQSPLGSSIVATGSSAIYGIFEELGTSIYGYSETEFFVRVVFNDPRVAKLCTYAFQKESSTSKSAAYLQPFNAHFPVTLQFFIDFLLHGMDMVYIRRRYSRHSLKGATHVGGIELVSPLKPITNVALEFDVYTDDILNPSIVRQSSHKLSGLAFIWEEERRRCELLGIDFQAPTPGSVGLPEVWTVREESLKKELHEVLLSIQRRGGLSQQSQSQNNPTPYSQQPLSQAVIADLREVSEDFTAEQCSNLRQNRSAGGHTSVVNDWREVWGEYGDDDFNEPNEDGNDEDKDTNENDMNDTYASKRSKKSLKIGEQREDDTIIENSVMKAHRDTDDDDVDGIELITLDEDTDSNNDSREDVKTAKDDGMQSVEIITLDDDEEDENRSMRRLDQVTVLSDKQTNLPQGNLSHVIYENAFTPWTPAPIRLDAASEDEEETVDKVENLREGVTFNEFTNSLVNETTWNRATLIDTPSHFEMATNTSLVAYTDSQKAYEQLMKTVKYSVENLSVLSLEILALSSESDVRPVADPKRDFIWAVFYAIDEDVCNRCGSAFNTNSQASSFVPSQSSRKRQFRGLIALSALRDPAKSFNRAYNASTKNLPPIYVSHEMQIFAELTNIVQRYDPEILIGYDTKRFSWGYLVERANFLGIPFLRNISRIRAPSSGGLRSRREVSASPQGRMQLEVWRVARHVAKEGVSLRCYRFTSVVKAILKRTFPELDPKWVHSALIEARQEKISGVVDTILQHYLDKCELNIEILDAMDVFIRTSQMARVYGIPLTEVLTRGSQFRVESFLLRLAAREKLHFVAPSISPLQRNLMDAPETIPLNLEPESSVYYDPVVVLDFQSLYPSVCIAHNYCYTTCLGKLSRLKEFAARYTSNDANGDMTLGALNSYVPCDVNQLLAWFDANQLSVSPTGGVFVKSATRQSLIAQMLTELLDTRVMVKKAMKSHAKCEMLRRLLNARQLALKLVANTTYGYMAANWSGRMPCEELADAVVGKGREALERAIATIHENSIVSVPASGDQPKYENARVIYGDTDSIFVLFEGRSRKDAFRIGEQIATDVTAQNPYPMKLKFEKVMQPCALITKKRYVGLSYESVDQSKPTFDAKGIETVRRDNCDFVSKTLEQMLHLLFEARPSCRHGKFYGGGLDKALSFLKYRLRHIRNIAPSEFIMNAAFRDGYSERTVIPVKKIADEMVARGGPRAMPIHGERLSYIIAVNTSNGESWRITVGGVTAHAVSVDEFFSNAALEPHYDYYVTRQLFPALQRFLQFFAIQLRWRNGTAARTFCLGCMKPKKYPFCKPCLLSCTPLVQQRVIQIRQYMRTRQVCRACLCAVKSLQNIEDMLGVTRCVNVLCANRQALALAERQVRPSEFRRHIQALKLDALSSF